MANYIHPSISSKIIDNSFLFITSQGTTKLFAVFTSDKGEDNEIKMITSPSEYLFHYGEPNIMKHGQANYNIMNWLKSGGVVYALRVLPENAGYANAIVNIQTRKGEKEVILEGDKKVTVPDVTIRPVVTYTKINNMSLSSLENEELIKNKKPTLDGFTNNLLFAVVPRGRGTGYNDLGFKISLTNGYDTTYGFRIYSFETVKMMDNGSMQTIEGPFDVALDPDALTVSGESIFIKTVVETYSKYFNIIFNEESFERLGKTINPHVSPSIIDFFNAQSRTIAYGKTETYTDPITNRAEDVHFYVNTYLNGVDTGKKNIITSDNKIESSSVEIDNDMRSKRKQESEESLNRIMESYSRIRKITGGSNPYYENLIKQFMPKTEGGDGVLEDSIKAAKDQHEKVTQSKTSLDVNGPTALEDIAKLIIELNELEDKIADSRSTIKQVLDYSAINGKDDDFINSETELDGINKVLYSIENFSIKFTDIKAKLLDMSIKINDVNFQNFKAEQVTYYNELLILAKNTINNLNKSDVATLEIANKFIQESIKQYNELLKSFNNINNDYLTQDEKDENLNKAFTQAKPLIEALRNAMNTVVVEMSITEMDKLIPLLESNSTQAIQILKKANTDSSTLKDEDMTRRIDLAKADVLNYKKLSYINIVQNFDTNIVLKYGSDGDIDVENPERKQEINKLFIKGLTGVLQPSLMDKKMYPIDLVMDANYDLPVKNAIIQLCNMRKDFMGFLDIGFGLSTPEQTINYRRNKMQVSDFRVALFSQDFIIDDAEYTGKKIKVTPSYYLSSKIPQNDNDFGIHWNFVGPRRGTIHGFEKLSYNPNPEWKEMLYKSQINYIEQDITRTKFGSQLTSQTVVSALSNINNVRTLLRIQRDVETLMEDFQFEWYDTPTLTAAQMALTGYLSQWVSNRACDSISGIVYGSDYDRRQKLLRVRVDLVFNKVIERISIDLVVNG